MSYAVETKALCKRYGEKRAVNQMSVHIKQGDIYGLIGKNGAGKTSLMKLLLGLTFPDSGSMQLFGSGDLNGERRKIGSLIEAPGLFKNESAYENMKRFSILSGGASANFAGGRFGGHRQEESRFVFPWYAAASGHCRRPAGQAQAFGAG